MRNGFSHDSPRMGAGLAAEDHHVMALAVQGTGKNRPDLPRSARNHDLHGTTPGARAVAAEERTGTRSDPTVAGRLGQIVDEPSEALEVPALGSEQSFPRWCAQEDDLEVRIAPLCLCVGSALVQGDGPILAELSLLDHLALERR